MEPTVSSSPFRLFLTKTPSCSGRSFLYLPHIHLWWLLTPRREPHQLLRLYKRLWCCNGRCNVTRAQRGDLVKLRDLKFDCDPYGNERFIGGADYNNLTGRLVITTTEAHGLSISETIKLSGIQMDCPAYGNDISITGASYDNTTGVISITVSEAHGLAIGDTVKLDALEFACPGSGITTTIFPDGTAPSLNQYVVETVPAANSLEVNVGTSTIPHTYVSGGNIFVGITTGIFPGSAQNSHAVASSTF